MHLGFKNAFFLSWFFIKWSSESLLWIKWYFHIETDVFILSNCGILAHRGRFPRLTVPETNRLTDIALARLRRDPKGSFLVFQASIFSVVFCCYSSFQGGLFFGDVCDDMFINVYWLLGDLWPAESSPGDMQEEDDDLSEWNIVDCDRRLGCFPFLSNLRGGR